jgi:hypothetical protein
MKVVELSREGTYLAALASIGDNNTWASNGVEVTESNGYGRSVGLNNR